MTVLLVEDDLFIRMDLEYRIKQLYSATVFTSSTGNEAIALAERHKPELILMDIKLKGEMNGIEAAVRICAFLSCRIVFISAFDWNDLEGMPRNANCSIEYYSKPISNKTLKELVTSRN